MSMQNCKKQVCPTDGNFCPKVKQPFTMVGNGIKDQCMDPHPKSDCVVRGALQGTVKMLDRYESQRGLARFKFPLTILLYTCGTDENVVKSWTTQKGWTLRCPSPFLCVIHRVTALISTTEDDVKNKGRRSILRVKGLTGEYKRGGSHRRGELVRLESS